MHKQRSSSNQVLQFAYSIDGGCKLFVVRFEVNELTGCVDLAPGDATFSWVEVVLERVE